MEEFVFIDKSVFFPEQGILAVGDLHVGYEHSFREVGILVPETQIKDIINSLEKIILEIRRRRFKLRKIIFLGDIKHFFSYEWREKFYFEKVTDFLKQYVKDKDIILIKGNHDKFDFSGKKMKNYYITKGLAFIHGHIDYPKIFEENVRTIIMGHLHPSVTLRDKQNIKRERYKCFLVGKFRGKQVVILPSFLGMVEGTPVNSEYFKNEEGFSIIPEKEIQNFRAHVINDSGEILDFGEVGNL